MLFSYILLTVNVMLTLILPISVFFSFKKGFQLGRAAEMEADLTKSAGNGAKARKTLGAAIKSLRPKEKPTPEQVKLNRILANLDTYNGSGEGQVKLDE